MRSPTPVVARLVLAPVALALLAGACSAPDYQYFKDPTSRSYFRLPSGWETFDTREVLRNWNASPQTLEAPALSVWMVAFDADPEKASLDHLFSPDADFPTGLAQVRVLAEEERRTFSQLSLRDALIDLNSRELVGTANILDEREIVLEGGYRGLRLTYNLVAGSSYLTVTQVGVVDPGTNLLYVFAVACEAACYLDNQSTIEQIVDSWTVKEPR